MLNVADSQAFGQTVGSVLRSVSVPPAQCSTASTILSNKVGQHLHSKLTPRVVGHRTADILTSVGENVRKCSPPLGQQRPIQMSGE